MNKHIKMSHLTHKDLVEALGTVILLFCGWKLSQNNIGFPFVSVVVVVKPSTVAALNTVALYMQENFKS